MRNYRIITSLVAGAAALASTNLGAQSAGAPYQSYPQSGQYQYQQNSETAPNFKASQLIGQPVRSQDGQQLGKVQDVIINLQAGTVPCAIIESGGTLGIGLIGQRRVAVPLQDLKWSNQDRELMVMATKQDLANASSSATGQWAAIQQQGGLGNVNRFFGQPSVIGQSRFERQPRYESNPGREPVRTPSEPVYQSTSPSRVGIVTMSQGADQQLASQINGVVQHNIPDASRNLQVVLKNGVVTLRGQVRTEQQRQMLERQIRALPGVIDVQSDLTTIPE